MTKALFTAGQLEGLAGALGDTNDGLTNPEIGYLFAQCRMIDPGPMTKRLRVYNAFVEVQNRRQDRTNILEFIRQGLAPARFVREPHRFEPLRARVNKALAFSGMVVTEAGRLEIAKAVSTLPEAERRARELRSDLELRRVHPDVLRFCRAELLADDYFHAVLEAAKSLAAKIRDKTGLTDDGSTLVDRALASKPPMLAISPLVTQTDLSRQSCFASLVRGVFSLFRNPTAHEPRIDWPMSREDAEDILTLISMLHRQLDATYMPVRTP
ncbi:TIGR02391 family protein [Brevundimonas kwangchunensis]|uniref:TIGR02391 family protein n=1 Tax=Brevundimonas kwangchunensis TaxID=322163 RepID=A0ABN1GYX7_9CAUL